MLDDAVANSGDPDSADSSAAPAGEAGASASGLVVVGYDGSSDSDMALVWAIAEARASSYRIRAVYVEHDVAELDSATATLLWSTESTVPSARPGESVTSVALQRAAAAGVEAEGVVAYGSSAAALVEHSKGAALVVIGSRGLGSLGSALLGSTGSHLSAHAHCPVVVVRAQPRSGPVVVGVDGSPESLETLDWALGFAQRHELAVEVIYAFEIPVYPEVVPYVPPAEVLEEVTAKANAAVEAEVGQRATGYPGVEVTARAVQDRASWALIEASREASLVVVGSHGRGSFTGMLLGSTSQSLLHHAHCTVAIIRHERHARRRRGESRRPD